MSRVALRVTLGILFSAAIAAVFINLKFVPRGVHLAKFVTDPSKPVGNRTQGGHNWIDFIMSEPLSELIFRYTGNYCDAPHYRDDGQLIAGQNMTIAMLVAAASDSTGQRRKRVLDELQAALLQCDPNALSPDQPIPPLHSAILFKDAETVTILLRSGAKSSARIVRPGKAIDGMSALEFAHHLEIKAQDDEGRHAYSEIATLILQQN